MWSRNMSAIKQAEKVFAALGKNDQQKPFWTQVKSTWKSC